MTNKFRTQEITCVILLTLFAFLLRKYKVDQLAVFLSDQAIDSYAVKHILSGDFTLLGPRASVGQFFNGPIVYYLMAPFYLIFNSDPIAGTLFQITLQIASMPLLYGLATRFGGLRAGLISLVIFTFSPLLINYSRATFNAYPAIFFTIIILYLLTFDRRPIIAYVVAGIFTGMLVQMHYFLYVYAGLHFFYVVYRVMKVNNGIENRRKGMLSILSFFGGLVIGLSPFLLFELRHDFFNFRSILASSSSIGQSIDMWSRIGSVGVAITSLFGFSSAGIGLLILVCVSAIVFVNKFDRKLKILYALTLLSLIICTVIYKGIMHSHYCIGFYAVFIVVLSVIISKSAPVRLLPILGVGYIVWFVTISTTSGLFSVSKDQDGFGLVDQRKAVSTLIEWKRGSGSSLSYNVTQDTQQDNRAMPLRYLLSLEKMVMQPLPVEEYGSNDELFLIAKRGVDLNTIRTWEVQSFGKTYTVVKRRIINSTHELLYLRKAY